MEASLELHDLLLGPSMCLRPAVCLSHCFHIGTFAEHVDCQLNGISLQAIYKYNIPSKVPLKEEISFTELAAKCELHEPDLRRILRFAMTFHRVFQERNPGYVSHSAASRRLVESSNAMDGFGYQFDEVWQAYAHVRNTATITAEQVLNVDSC